MAAEKIKELIKRGQVTRVHELSADGVQWQKPEHFSEFYPTKNQAIVVAETSDSVKTVVATPVRPTPEWYAHVGNEQEGPVDEETLRAWVAAGRVTSETLIWKSGLAEWATAKSLHPQWFPEKLAGQVTPNANSSAVSHIVGTGIVRELQKRSTWVYVLSIAGVVFSGLFVAYMVFVLVTQFVAPAETGSDAVIAIFLTLFVLFLAVLGLVACICLFQYANALSVLHYAPTEENILRSLKKLSSFWTLAGIHILAVLVTSLLVALLVYAAGVRLLHVLGR